MQYQSLTQLDFIPSSPVHQSPRDWRDVVIYFLLVDRFDNDDPTVPPYSPDGLCSPAEPEKGGLFQGGNLQGVRRRLPYLKELGAGAIWLSPIFANRQENDDSYHGYGIQNFLEVDPRFGTLDDLRELVRDAHQLGLYVILDIILNHTGDNWAYPGNYRYFFSKDCPEPFPFGFWREHRPEPGFQATDAVWPIEFQDREWYKRRGEIRNWGDQDEAVNGDFLSLKELNVRRTDVLNGLIQVYKYWIGAADIDGFRIDTVKHMEDSATALFCNAIREYTRKIGKHNFFIFGEIVGDDTTLQRYIGRNSRIEGTSERFPSLDACLDFPLYFVLEEVIKGFINPAELRQRYERFRTSYADHGAAGEHFVTFADNHDQMSRPYNRFLHKNQNTAQIVLALGYLLTSPGVPCIYYGSEQNFNGGGDSDKYVRECMFGGTWGAFDTKGHHFFNTSTPTFKQLARIIEIRASLPALRYGRQYFREISGNGEDFGHPIDGKCLLAYSRLLDCDEVVIVLNLDAARRKNWVTVDSNFHMPGQSMTDLLGNGGAAAVVECGGRKAFEVELDGHQMAIFCKA